ncbi:MAG TPA: TAT-variant-translocated molybdopterin oxidoreductase [Chthoniobacteraceae bacterium]|nr:TAT-variant-translocated molybdopterin oxidoreductase [Chthoniobacteraceae bacterium]
MKHIFHHPPENLTGRKYWRSLGELADTPEFREKLEREFPAGAAELKLDQVTRRNFLKLMGASTALAGLGLAACRHPKSLVPFTKSSEWSIPGKSLFFATSMPRRNGAQPLLVTTHDGRPTKIEGNPQHPVSNGATDAASQASVLDLYDPDRSRFFLHKGERSDVVAFEAFLEKEIAEAGDGSGLVFLVDDYPSPTRERLRGEIARRFPKARWVIHDPLGNETWRAAAAASFGPEVVPVPVIEKADILLSLDCDFLGTDERALSDVRAFSARRNVEKPGDSMNRLYVVENRFTVTGGMADHRLRLPASQVGTFALALAEELGVSTGGAVRDKGVTFPDGWVRELAADLKAHHGKSLVLVGSRQPVAVQILVAAINQALGSFGNTIVGQPANLLPEPGLTLAELAAQVDSVKTLVILGGNPAYTAPSNLDWEAKQQKIPNVIRLGLWEDESSQGALWQVPAAHYLETWGDGIAADGSYTPQQPMILPLYDGWSEYDLLARFAGRPKPTGSELVQETYRSRFNPADFVTAWDRLLHDGRAQEEITPAPIAFRGTVPSDGFPKPVTGDAIEIVFPADTKMDDGRFNNNGWMQECPDPVTRTTWDNVAWISPNTAKRFGIKHPPFDNDHQLIELELDGRKLRVPAYIVPGHADNSISLSLGWGRRVVGRVGRGTGVNAYTFATTAAPYFAVGLKITNLDETFPVASTQEHFTMEGRELVREATVTEYAEHPDAIGQMGGDSHMPPAGYQSLYTHPKLDAPNQWGMAIDLNTCVGCTACVIACQAENNVPIVGKEQVINGRSMHWLRNDRYFVSDGNESQDNYEYATDPDMVIQPMMCQHCENAPCETVCPVNATVHSEDGLNVMAYNRCIGTRYCANNCPFKVRRFNFFDYNQRPITPVEVPLLGEVNGLKLGPLTKKGMAETLKMQKNPNVTVRMRGVMEKCTFCVQRIQTARIATKVKAGASDDVRIPTDSFTTACAQACASGSIVFGDISDPESRVSKLKAQQKNYRLLEYLNVRTRVSYLARLRNPNPKMPDARRNAAKA